MAMAIVVRTASHTATPVPRASAVSHAGERADEIAGAVARIAVLADERGERGVGARARVGGEMPFVAAEQRDEIGHALADRLLVALEVRVAQLAQEVGEDLAHHRLLAAVIERPGADLRDQSLAESVGAAGAFQ